MMAISIRILSSVNTLASSYKTNFVSKTRGNNLRRIPLPKGELVSRARASITSLTKCKERETRKNSNWPRA